MKSTFLYALFLVAACATVGIYLWSTASAPKVERSFKLKINAPRD
jgi:hypothetical protein